VNKFEALQMFQAWPPEWQRLCAECWIETGEVDPKFVLAFPKQAAGELAQRDPIPMPSDQPKAAKMAAIPHDIQERICNGESVFLARNESHLSDFNSAMENAKASGKPSAAKVAAVKQL
jgi:hypothetical protein